ncbi:MAG: hypothetical protein FJ144_01955 [Deltaproteobacteria bacterium]|nr:hypothetical protein [Deltaproteobacteria bacterium]
MEPGADDAIYEAILEVVERMAGVMERSPRAFSEMDEEALRTHFLVQLNGQFEWDATGETFNFTGKTDILVNYEGRRFPPSPLFIARSCSGFSRAT